MYICSWRDDTTLWKNRNVMQLDASKAFDRIKYVKLFKILLDKGLRPLVCRLIYSSYLNQKIRNKWGNSLSQCFKVTDGVKQGAVLSPLLLMFI